MSLIIIGYFSGVNPSVTLQSSDHNLALSASPKFRLTLPIELPLQIVNIAVLIASSLTSPADLVKADIVEQPERRAIDRRNKAFMI